MVSQVTAQQYGSCVQISVAHVSQLFLSFAPVVADVVPAGPSPPPPPSCRSCSRSCCPSCYREPPVLLPELLPPPPQLAPQIEPTSPTQIESQSVLQQ